MKVGLFFIVLLGWVLAASAQSCLPEWLQYTYGGFLYDIQSDHNSDNLSETAFKNKLLDIARTNLAKKVQMQVKEEAVLNKQAVDGRSSIVYSSSTHFSTDVNLKLVDSKMLYDASTKQGAVIVFIDKVVACKHYRNEIERLLAKVDNALTTANNYVASGFKDRARLEMKAVLPEFGKTEEPFFWLSFFGVSAAELTDLTGRCHTRQQAVKQMIADLKHGILICLSCTTDLFGSPYPALQNELKGKLAAGGCSFTDDPAEADWVVGVNVAAREYNIAVLGGMTSYFAYADARVTIDKSATSQRIYEDELAEKGGHTRNYAKAARAAYKELSKRLAEVLKENIRE